MAVLLAEEGAKVEITDRKPDGAKAVLDEIKRAGGEAIFIQQDVTKEADWQRVMAES